MVLWGIVNACTFVEMKAEKSVSNTLAGECALRELFFCKNKKCCKNWKHGKRCKKCPKK